MANKLSDDYLSGSYARQSAEPVDLDSFQDEQDERFDQLEDQIGDIRDQMHGLPGDIAKETSKVNSGLISSFANLTRNFVNTAAQEIATTTKESIRDLTSKLSYDKQWVGGRLGFSAGGPLGALIGSSIANSGIGERISDGLKSSFVGVKNKLVESFNNRRHKQFDVISNRLDITNDHFESLSCNFKDSIDSNKELKKSIDSSFNSLASNFNSKLTGVVGGEPRSSKDIAADLNSKNMFNTIPTMGPQFRELIDSVNELKTFLTVEYPRENSLWNGVKDFLGPIFRGGMYVSDIEKSSNPFVTLTSGIIQIYRFQRLYGEVTMRQLNELIMMGGGRPQKLIGKNSFMKELLADNITKIQSLIDKKREKLKKEGKYTGLKKFMFGAWDFVGAPMASDYEEWDMKQRQSYMNRVKGLTTALDENSEEDRFTKGELLSALNKIIGPFAFAQQRFEDAAEQEILDLKYGYNLGLKESKGKVSETTGNIEELDEEENVLREFPASREYKYKFRQRYKGPGTGTGFGGEGGASAGGISDVVQLETINWKANPIHVTVDSFDTLSDILTSTVGHNAKGTDNWKGGPTKINEEGGEFAVLPKGSKVIPHDKSLKDAFEAGKTKAIDLFGKGNSTSEKLAIVIDEIKKIKDKVVEGVSNTAKQLTESKTIADNSEKQASAAEEATKLAEKAQKDEKFKSQFKEKSKEKKGGLLSKLGAIGKVIASMSLSTIITLVGLITALVINPRGTFAFIKWTVSSFPNFIKTIVMFGKVTTLVTIGIGKFLNGIAKLLGIAAKGATKGGLVRGAAGFAAKAVRGASKKFVTKIPIIGSLLSIFFAISRFKKGEIVGGLLEIASGIASLFPSVGTAISLGIDSLLIMYDINKNQKYNPKTDTKGGVRNTKGRAIMKSLPGIGAVMSIFDSIKEFKSGHWVRGIGEFVSAVASLIAGTGIGLPFMVVSAILQHMLYEDREGEIKPEKKNQVSLGMFHKILKLIPGVGTIISIMDAIKEFKGGHWVRGIGEITSAILSAAALIPGIGFLPLAAVGVLQYLMNSSRETDVKPEKKRKQAQGKWRSVIKGIPVIGSVFSVLDAIHYFTKGDTKNGIYELVSAIPIVGGFVQAFLRDSREGKVSIQKSTGNPILDIFRELGKYAWDKITEVFTSIKKGFLKIFGWFGKLFGSIGKGFKKAWDKTASAVKKGWEFVKHPIKGFKEWRAKRKAAKEAEVAKIEAWIPEEVRNRLGKEKSRKLAELIKKHGPEKIVPLFNQKYIEAAIPEDVRNRIGKKGTRKLAELIKKYGPDQVVPLFKQIEDANTVENLLKAKVKTDDTREIVQLCKQYPKYKDKILAMVERGMSLEEIKEVLRINDSGTTGYRIGSASGAGGESQKKELETRWLSIMTAIKMLQAKGGDISGDEQSKLAKYLQAQELLKKTFAQYGWQPPADDGSIPKDPTAVSKVEVKEPVKEITRTATSLTKVSREVTAHQAEVAKEIQTTSNTDNSTTQTTIVSKVSNSLIGPLNVDAIKYYKDYIARYPWAAFVPDPGNMDSFKATYEKWEQLSGREKNQVLKGAVDSIRSLKKKKSLFAKSFDKVKAVKKTDKTVATNAKEIAQKMIESGGFDNQESPNVQESNNSNRRQQLDENNKLQDENRRQEKQQEADKFKQWMQKNSQDSTNAIAQSINSVGKNIYSSIVSNTNYNMDTSKRDAWRRDIAPLQIGRGI